MAGCWDDGLAGLVTGQGVAEWDCLKGGMTDGGWLNSGIGAGIVG